ncbi:MAG: hypothetical protein ACKO21_11540 [Nodosilinea sp.]
MHRPKGDDRCPDGAWVRRDPWLALTQRGTAIVLMDTVLMETHCRRSPP